MQEHWARVAERIVNVLCPLCRKFFRFRFFQDVVSLQCPLCSAVLVYHAERDVLVVAKRGRR